MKPYPEPGLYKTELYLEPLNLPGLRGVFLILSMKSIQVYILYEKYDMDAVRDFVID